MAIDSSHGHEMCTVGKLYVVKRGAMMVAIRVAVPGARGEFEMN